MGRFLCLRLCWMLATSAVAPEGEHDDELIHCLVLPSGNCYRQHACVHQRRPGKVHMLPSIGFYRSGGDFFCNIISAAFNFYTRGFQGLQEASAAIRQLVWNGQGAIT